VERPFLNSSRSEERTRHVSCEKGKRILRAKDILWPRIRNPLDRLHAGAVHSRYKAVKGHLVEPLHDLDDQVGAKDCRDRYANGFRKAVQADVNAVIMEPRRAPQKPAVVKIILLPRVNRDVVQEPPLAGRGTGPNSPRSTEHFDRHSESGLRVRYACACPL